MKYNPTTIDFVLDDKCNLTCKGCIKQVFSKKNTFIKSGAYIPIINGSLGVKIDNIHFTGGEPFLNIESIKEIINHIMIDNAPLPKLSIYSNLTILSQETIEFLKLFDITLHTSIDGFELENDLLRGAGSFKSTLENIKRLKENGVEVNSITTTLKNENFNEISIEFVNFLSQTMVPVWRLNIDYYGLRFDPETVTQKIYSFYKLAIAKGLKVEGTWLYPFGNMLHNNKKGFCPALKGEILTILPNGLLSLCPYSCENIGSLKNDTETLSKNFKQSQKKHFNLNINNCKLCFIKEYCHNHCLVTTERGSQALNDWYCLIYKNLTYLLLKNYISTR